MAEYLVELGIDSISVKPDTVLKTTGRILELEQRLGRAPRNPCSQRPEGAIRRSRSALHEVEPRRGAWGRANRNDRARSPGRVCSRHCGAADTRWSGRPCATRDRLRGARLRRASCPSAGPSEQDGGTYRLERRDDEALFGFAVGPALVEALPAPAEDQPVAGAAPRRTARSRSTEEPDEPPRVRVPRRALVRPARDRDPGPGADRGRAPRPGTTARGARARSSSRSTAGPPAGTCFCVSMETGPKATFGFDLALTEVIEPDATASSSRWARERGRRGARGACRHAAARRRRRARGRAVVERTAAEHGPRAGDRRDQGAALPQLRAPALGRGRRALPDLRQLHHGLPDLLLHRRSRTSPTWPAPRPSASREWDSCFTIDFTLHPRRQRPLVGALALPPVDDPQARHLVRPVRHLRLRRLRPLHHLVPGRRSTSPRRRRSIRRDGRRDAMSEVGRGIGGAAGRGPDHAAGSRIEHLELIAGCGANRGRSRMASGSSRGRAGRRLLRAPARPRRARDATSRAAAR